MGSKQFQLHEHEWLCKCRLLKAIALVFSKKKQGQKAGFPRFKSFERVKSFTYPQSGFKLFEKEVELSKIGTIEIRKHRDLNGEIKTLTIKKSPSGKWFAIFTSELDQEAPTKKPGEQVGLDLGIEHFAYLSNGKIIENQRHLKKTAKKLKKEQRRLSRKQKGSKNRRKARTKVAIAYENLVNKRRDFLHKVTHSLVNSYSLIALENLNVSALSKGFLAKEILDCSFAEFTNLLHYKAEEAGCEIKLVNPAYTTQQCSNCSLIQKKLLVERRHHCSCGADMPRDLNSAINIYTKATCGQQGSNACGEETSAHN
jgi:putative transposase